MKILSLTQPWASLMAIGAKRFETRSWGTNYRGDIAIHETKGFPAACRDLCREEPFYSTLGRANIALDFAAYPGGCPASFSHEPARGLPLGFVICVVELVEVTAPCNLASYDVGRRSLFLPRLADSRLDGAGNEGAFGDYSPGRSIWITRNLRPLRRAVVARGAQGLRDLDPAIEALVRAEIA